MKRINIEPFIIDCNDCNTTKLGLEWMWCLEGPFYTIPKPDKDYYSYLVINFHFIFTGFHIEIYYKKMPYRNISEYIAWKKAGVTSKVGSNNTSHNI